MNRCRLVLGLLLAFTVFGFAQSQPAPATEPNPQTSPSGVPQGTTPVKRYSDTVVQPVAKPINVTPDVVRSAQQRLADKGYNPGPADGVAGAQTRAALRKFQADEGLRPTGRLDQPTLAKLDVGATQQLGSAPADIGRGGKAFGHDVKEGHPVEAGKALGKGGESFGKKVGEGAKSGAIGIKDKAGEGVSKIGDKLSGKSDKSTNENNPK